MVDFAGWSMPVQYTSIAEEHHATRTAVGVFDISHMGRLRFDGPNAAQFLDRSSLAASSTCSRARFATAWSATKRGGILDDVLVYRAFVRRQSAILDGRQRQQPREDRGWLSQHARAPAFRPDDTLRTAMIAVQGPAIAFECRSLIETSAPIAKMRDYLHRRRAISSGDSAGQPHGLHGRRRLRNDLRAELLLDCGNNSLSRDRNAVGGMAVGLGARDTLRLEAAMPLYGHELSEAINPIQAGLDFAVNLERPRVHRQRGARAIRRKTNLSPSASACKSTASACRAKAAPCCRATKSSAKSPAARFRRRSNEPIAMAYVQPTAAKPSARNWPSTSAAPSTPPPSCRCRFTNEEERINHGGHREHGLNRQVTEDK